MGMAESEPGRRLSPRYCWGRLQACFRTRLLVVEPALILLILAKMSSTIISEQYYYFIYGKMVLENTSFPFPNSSFFCMSSEIVDNYTGSKDTYKQVESESNHLVAYAGAANTVFSVLTTIMLGPLTDKYGRKVGMFFPALGTTLQYSLSAIIVNYNLHPYYFILANSAGGVFGSLTGMLAASFSYVADVTSLRWRSLRIGVMEAALAFGSCAGNVLSSFWLQRNNCDFVPPLCFCAGINLLVTVYVLLIPESISRKQRKELNDKNPRGFKALVQGFRLYCGGLSLRSTWKLYVCTLVLIIAVINIFGSTAIDVYFAKAVPFDFDPLHVGIFKAVGSASQGLSNVFLLGLLVVVGVGDVWIMIIATVGHCTCKLLLGFANKSWELYAITAARGIEGITWSGSRGLMSKLVRPEQQGAIFSIIASIESLAALLSSVTWPLIFPLTLQYNMRPGTTYIFMAATASLLLPLLISLLCLKKESQVVSHKSGSIQSHDGTSPHSIQKHDENSPLLN